MKDQSQPNRDSFVSVIEDRIALYGIEPYQTANLEAPAMIIEAAVMIIEHLEKWNEQLRTQLKTIFKDAVDGAIAGNQVVLQVKNEEIEGLRDIIRQQSIDLAQPAQWNPCSETWPPEGQEVLISLNQIVYMGYWIREDAGDREQEEHLVSVWYYAHAGTEYFSDLDGQPEAWTTFPAPYIAP